MTDFRVILLLITSGANLGLALFIIFKDFRNKIRIHFSLMLFWISMWSLFSALFIISPSIEAVNKISISIIGIASALLLGFIFDMVLSYFGNYYFNFKSPFFDKD